MRNTNLILHIVSWLFLGFDTILIGINFLMGLGYFDDEEMVIALFALLLFLVAPLVSLVGGIISSAASKKIKPGAYMALEIVIYSISMLCFGLMIAFVIVSNIQHYFNQVPGLSTGYTNVSIFDLAGFCIGIAGIIVTVSGVRKLKANN